MRKDGFFNYDSVIGFLEKEIKKKGYLVPESIGLTGGETTICPDFFRIINYIRNKFPEIVIKVLTNGRMFAYKDFRKKCLIFKKVDFIIPLHGYDAKSHDQITQSPGSFEQTSEGLKKLLAEKRADQKIEIRIIATRLNLKIIPKILELIKEKFFDVERIVLIFLEFEGKAELNKNKVGITYQEINPILAQIKNYFQIFKEFRLYHFPLCVLEPIFWPYAWRTLPKEEITFLPKCQKCQLKKYCLGIHKSYFNYLKKPEIKPWIDLKRIKIKESKNFYKPINSIKQ
jgi:MoaA/NifB/PqqE/SkfB family radical SAM enzyme